MQKIAEFSWESAAIHMIAGAVSGAMSAGINGGDLGLSVLTSAISAGVAEGVGGQFSTLDKPYQLAGRMVIGGVVGGVTSAAYGGDFGRGFAMGAFTAALAYVCNKLAHELQELGKSGKGYYTYGRKDAHYGTENTIKSIEEIGSKWDEAHPGDPRVGVGNISLQEGGTLPPHTSHKFGLDVDLRPIRNDGIEGPVDYHSSNYSQQLTQDMVDIIRADPNCARILFNDPNIKGVFPYPNHDNHLHVHFKR